MRFTNLLFSILACVGEEVPFDPSEYATIDEIKHTFYDAFYYTPEAVTAEKLSDSSNPDVVQSVRLSAEDDWEEFIELSWDFKFYGHPHDWIAISPNGFITTHKDTCRHPTIDAFIFCNWYGEDNIASYRRYMAPLMSDFNPSGDDDAHVYYHIDDENKKLIVQWHNIPLWYDGDDITTQSYRWDFQIELRQDGTIFFYYFDVPALPKDILADHLEDHEYYTQTVGLEDAAYQYTEDEDYLEEALSPVPVDSDKVLNKHTVVFIPKETCIDQLSCSDCKDINVKDPVSPLQCGWCPTLNVCSDGLGRDYFDFADQDYCTADEMLDHIELANDECVDYDVNHRQCDENDQVLSKRPSAGDTEQYHSGVIVGKNSGSNKFLVKFDFSSGEEYVPYSSVHPCATVSHYYSSFALPPHCTPHCSALSSKGGSTSKGPNKTAIEISVISGLLLTLAAVLVIMYYCHRHQTEREMMSPQRMLMVNQNADRGVPIPDEPEDTFTNPSPQMINLTPQGNSDIDGDSEVAEAPNANRIVSNPILSPPPKWVPRKEQVDDASVPESSSQVVELQIESEPRLEMEDVELESVNQSESIPQEATPEYPQEKDSRKDLAYDMTPLGQ